MNSLFSFSFLFLHHDINHSFQNLFSQSGQKNANLLTSKKSSSISSQSFDIILISSFTGK
ncbi:hypothetical protein HOF65_02190 [bacterium]|nr:hypothetical protein [bacterium]MBT3852812.1 hypothetical protein [bacterium]MBT4632815.1 hypothetical protein [bacterium]MBT6778220.1 hypothetical protein [bacterium]